MTRNLKVLGLALVAMLMMGIAASAAMATTHEFHSEASGEITVTGSQTTENTFTTDSGTIHCSTATFTGTATGPTTTTTTLTPTYSGCQSTGFIEANVTVDTNKCHYTVHSHHTTTVAPIQTVPTELTLVNCEAGKPGIVVTAPFCTITVSSGQSFTGITFTNTGSGANRKIITDAAVENINYSESGFACKNSGSSTTGGKYSGSVTIESASGGLWYE